MASAMRSCRLSRTSVDHPATTARTILRELYNERKLDFEKLWMPRFGPLPAWIYTDQVRAVLTDWMQQPSLKRAEEFAGQHPEPPTPSHCSPWIS
jgi:hypothetical protein